MYSEMVIFTQPKHPPPLPFHIPSLKYKMHINDDLAISMEATALNSIKLPRLKLKTDTLNHINPF